MMPSAQPSSPRAFIGTAGWTLPRAEQDHFGPGTSHLERYGTRFGAVEINSSFYRSHRPATWEKWRDVVPPGFRFSVKMPKQITHEARLVDAKDTLARFLDEAGNLGPKLGCLLVQLPPSLRFDSAIAGSFFEQLRARTDAPVACEPRHAGWFAPEPEALLAGLQIARGGADPARVAAAAEPGGWRDLVYLRLHGSPKIYYSGYSADFLSTLARQIEVALANAATVWCIFDNTAAGAATGDARALTHLLTRDRPAEARPG